MPTIQKTASPSMPLPIRSALCPENWARFPESGEPPRFSHTKYQTWYPQHNSLFRICSRFFQCNIKSFRIRFMFYRIVSLTLKSCGDFMRVSLTLFFTSESLPWQYPWWICGGTPARLFCHRILPQGFQYYSFVQAVQIAVGSSKKIMSGSWRNALASRSSAVHRRRGNPQLRKFGIVAVRQTHYKIVERSFTGSFFHFRIRGADIAQTDIVANRIKKEKVSCVT